jgi:hypothetical protein
MVVRVVSACSGISVESSVHRSPIYAPEHRRHVQRVRPSPYVSVEKLKLTRPWRLLRSDTIHNYEAKTILHAPDRADNRLWQVSPFPACRMRGLVAPKAMALPR